MKIIRLLHLVTARGFYRWAMSEIHPVHPDVPMIVLRQLEIEDALRAHGF